jgi:multiple sugar transport system substrate-binding protein
MKSNESDNRPRMGANRRDMLRLMGGAGLAGGLIGRPGFLLAQDAFDWKQFAGTKINMLIVGGEGDDRAFADLVPEFMEQTGIEVEITAPALGPLIETTLQNLQAEQSGYDVISYLGFLTTQQVGAGFYDRLNDYIDNPAITPPDWDFPDFLQPALRNVGLFNLETGERGVGEDVYGIPGTHSGSVIYFYRKDLFDAAGLQPARTWDEFQAAAEALHSDEVAGASFIGANDFSLALVDWYTRFITIGGVLMTGSPQTKDFTPHVDSPEAVRALQMLIDLLPYAPENVTRYGCAENVDGFSTGKIAQMIFWSTIAGPIFNEENSMVATVTGTGPVPADPGQTPRSIQGGWGISIPKNSDPAKKDAAWLTLAWFTSKRVNNYLVEAYQIDANRTSSFTDPALVAKFPYLTDALAAASTAQTLETSNIPETFQLNDVMNVEFNAALLGIQDAQTACTKVQEQWLAMLRSAGHLT